MVLCRRGGTKSHRPVYGTLGTLGFQDRRLRPLGHPPEWEPTGKMGTGRPLSRPLTSRFGEPETEWRGLRRQPDRRGRPHVVRNQPPQLAWQASSPQVSSLDSSTIRSGFVRRGRPSGRRGLPPRLRAPTTLPQDDPDDLPQEVEGWIKRSPRRSRSGSLVT